jgi:hypothetical protein
MTQAPFDGWNKPQDPGKRRLKYLALILIPLLVAGYFYQKRTKEKAAAAAAAERAAHPVEKTEWSTDEIASDPEGYLKWADANIAKQIAQRQEMLKNIAERSVQISKRRDEVVGDLSEVETFYQRLDAAVKRAQAEGRWPVQVGSKKFDQAKAEALLAELPKQIELRKPLATDYDEALKAMTARKAGLESDLVSLGHLREKIALDAERIKLNKGVEELSKLSRTSQEISSMAGLVGSGSGAGEAPPAVGGSTGIMDLEEMMK